MNEDGEVKRFVHDGWEIRISVAAVPIEGQTAGHAELWRDGVQRCRIALSGRYGDVTGASDALERKAKAWVDEWNLRPHNGESGFANI